MGAGASPGKSPAPVSGSGQIVPYLAPFQDPRLSRRHERFDAERFRRLTCAAGADYPLGIRLHDQPHRRHRYNDRIATTRSDATPLVWASPLSSHEQIGYESTSNDPELYPRRGRGALNNSLASLRTRSLIAQLMPLLCLAVLATATMALRAWTSTLHVPISFNEGFDAYQTLSWIETNRLYYGSNELIVNNYPPLFFILVGSIARHGLDIIYTGRVVSWFAFLSCGCVIGLIIFRLHRDWIAGTAGAFVFWGAMSVQFPLQIGTNEPQMCSHLMALLGVFVGIAGRSGWASAGAAALMVVGIFFKHNCIAIPVAFGLWLVVMDRRAAIYFMVSAAIAGMAGLGLCLVAFGPEFAQNMLGPRPWDVLTGVRHLLIWLTPLAGVSALAAIALTAASVQPATSLFAASSVLSLLVGGFTLLSRGVYYNALFELVISLSLGVAHGLAAWPAAGPVPAHRIRPVLLSALAAVLFIGPDVTDLKSLVTPTIFTARMHERELATRRIVAALSAAPGPAICEILAYCYWAGKPFEVEPFNLSQRMLAGAGADATLVERLRRREFAAAAVDGSPPPEGASLFSAAVWAALRSGYEVAALSGTTTVFVRAHPIDP